MDSKATLLVAASVLMLAGPPAPVLAQNSCSAEIERIEDSLQRTRLDDATRISATEKLRQAGDAESSGAVEQCRDLVQQLKEMLHLDH